MEELVIEVLKKNRLDLPCADPKTPVIIQSFSPESLRKMRFELKTKLPLTLLITGDSQNKWLSADGMKRIKEFADGVGPVKGLIEHNPEIVSWAHEAGLTVESWTFRSDSTGRFKDAREEMRHFLFDYGVDALFTNNPDLFPRPEPGSAR
ncbi:MAG: hypothetical protein J2P21_19315 [Chloracidobacterium sp.]|nr:hypothetical protein [Chloracidobacterium sp.]